jgi:CheY-like chemotaxis protein
MLTTSGARVLVVADIELEAKLLVRALADFGFTNLTHRTDVAGALAAIESAAPQIIITDLVLGASDGFDLVRAVRARADHYIYVIMMGGTRTDARLREAFEVGVDDFVVKPLHAEEMIARLRAGVRIVELEARLRIRSKELETALRRIDVSAAQRALAKASATSGAVAIAADGGGLSGLLGSKGWRGAEELFAKTLADFLQMPAVPTAIGEQPGSPFVADVLLLEPARQLEIGVSVLADDASMRVMATHLLGDDDPEGARALVLEIGNMMMGALKAALIADGHTFTAGIPSAMDFAQAREALDAHPIRHRFAVACGESKLELWVRAREKINSQISGRSLVEGMVIGEDLHDTGGMLLLRAGTRLSQTAAVRLARLAPELEVVVGDPRR